MDRKQAVALKYEKQRDKAPRIVAKGAGEVAKAMIATAKQNQVPVLQNEDVVAGLMHLELDAVIPEELYLPIAEILAYVYKNRDQK